MSSEVRSEQAEMQDGDGSRDFGKKSNLGAEGDSGAGMGTDVDGYNEATELIEIDMEAWGVPEQESLEIDEDLRLFQEDEMVKSALSKGVDLRHYGQQLERGLRSVEDASVQDYVSGAEDVAALFTEVSRCDEVLASMQSVLSGFQRDLSGISDQIRTLQQDSLSMNHQLRNRRAVRAQLEMFLDHVVIDDVMTRHICDGPIDLAFVSHLSGLHRRIQFIQAAPSAIAAPSRASAQQDREGADADAGTGADPFPEDSLQGVPTTFGGMAPIEAPSARETVALVERLRAKAVARTRAYLLSEVQRLRGRRVEGPTTADAAGQRQTQSGAVGTVAFWQQSMAKLAPLNLFLRTYAGSVAAEVEAAYADAMARLLVGVYKTYNDQLTACQASVGTKQDLVAVEEGAVKGLFSSKVDLSKRMDAFCINDRASVITGALDPPVHGPTLRASVKETPGAKVPYEVIFRSQQMHLATTAATEFLFLRAFFGTERAGDLFQDIFARVLSQSQSHLENYLLHCYDAVAVLLMIRITHAHRQHMSLQRKLHLLDSYFDRVVGLLWDRFAQVVHVNARSMTNANPAKLGAVDTHPHYSARRFGELAASLAVLSGVLRDGGVGTGPLASAQSELREAIGNLLERLAGLLPEENDRVVFLTNNYAQILTVLTERGAPAMEQDHFAGFLATQQRRYVEREVANEFGDLQTVVRRSERSLGIAARPEEGTGAGAGEAARRDARELEQQSGPDLKGLERVTRGFSATWRAGMNSLHGRVLTRFTNFKVGMEILKEMLTHVVLLRSRLATVLTKAFAPSPPDFVRGLVSNAEMMLEIKQYSHAF